MSTRGRPPGGARRPTTPPDPSLTTRPVPSHRDFRPLCFGQGTASDPPFRTPVELDNLSEADPALSRELTYQRSLDEVRKLLDLICDQALAANPDDVSCHIPTWGFWVFITEYSPFALENLSRAIKNLVKVTERNLGLSLPAYRSEAARRFKLDVVQDKEALEGASDDRLREEFKSLLRGLNLMDKDDYPTPMLGSTMACLALDEKAIDMLAALQFGEEDTMKDYCAFEGKNIRVIDVLWVREPTEWPDSDPNARLYRGADDCPIVFLRSLYFKLTNGSVLDELFPLQNVCY